MDEFEIAVLETAMDCAKAQHALDCGTPAQQMLKKATDDMASACAALAAENEGDWVVPEPAPEFTLRRFHNGFRILLNIDKPEFIAAGGSELEWPAFRDNPHRAFICAPDTIAAGLWKIIIEGTKP